MTGRLRPGTQAQAWTDVLIVTCIGALTTFLSGAQRWTGFNSPDSEFYASLALFGDDVAGRAIDPAYTTTRLGYIAPVRVLVTTLDPWIGFAIWRLVLITLIVGSLYALVRMVSTRQLAVLVSAAGALNTVVLSYVGNTYLTGTVMAGVLLLLALGAWPGLGSPSRAWLPALLSGATAAWLVMTNPYGFLLGLSMWFGLRTLVLVSAKDGRWRALARDTVLAAVGFGVVFSAFLLAGRVIFPGRSWLGTYLDWNARLDYSVFVGDPDVWQRDVALLVPAAAVVVALIALALGGSRRAAIVAVAVAVLNWVFTFGYLWLVPGPWLEAPTYVALLWPGALAAVALSFASIVGRRSLGPAGWITGLLALPFVLWAGRWELDLTGVQGLAIALVMLVLVAAAALLVRRSESPSGRVTAVSVVLALAAMTVGAQVLQNGRGLLGIYGQFPFRAAYVDFQAEHLMRAKAAAEEFVLAQTAPDDVVGVWTDADRLTSGIAAMQLWSNYNAVGYSATLTPEETERLEQVKPSALAMYAPSRDQIYAFWQSLPARAGASVPECTTVPFLGIGSPEAHVCVTHLAWP